jgi:selenium metabolism protein YedF
MADAKTVDARGLPCPRPVIETKKALEEIKEGSITVIVDRPDASENVQRFAKSQGCKVKVSQKEGVFRIAIDKTQSTKAEARKSDDVVFITTDKLGTGDERLGGILMKAFLNTLWDNEPKPARIIFMNSGVKLTVEGSDVLEALMLLEQDGVQIFSCGTCLDYYGIKDKLTVGKVTNMYETVHSLTSAGKVIKI